MQAFVHVEDQVNQETTRKKRHRCDFEICINAILSLRISSKQICV